MSGYRQFSLGVFMAFLTSALVLGSISLSLQESGYGLASAPTSQYTQIVFSGQQIINIVGAETESAGESGAGLIVQTPTAVSCTYPPGWVQTTVLPDDTLAGVAARYNTEPEKLKTANCMLTEGLVTGSYLYVPPMPTLTPIPPRPTATICRPPYGWVTYIVRPGDTLGRLAASVGMTPASLAAANCLGSSMIYGGQVLAVPYLPAPIYPTATYPSWPTPTFIWFPTLTRTWIATVQPTWQGTWTPGVTDFPIDTPTTIPPTHGWTQMPPTTEPPVPTTELPAPTIEPPTQQPEPTQVLPTQPPAPTQGWSTPVIAPTQVPPTQPPAPTQDWSTPAPAPTQVPPIQPPATTQGWSTPAPAPAQPPATQQPAPIGPPATQLLPTSEAPTGWLFAPPWVCALFS